MLWRVGGSTGRELCRVTPGPHVVSCKPLRKLGVGMERGQAHANMMSKAARWMKGTDNLQAGRDKGSTLTWLAHRHVCLTR